MKHNRLTIHLCALTLVSAGLTPLLAQDPPPLQDQLSIAALESRIAAAEKAPEGEDRAALLREYRGALEHLRETKRFEERRAELARLGREAPAALERARAELATLTGEAAVSGSDLEASAVDAKIAEETRRLESLRSALGELEGEADRRAKRRLEIAGERVDAQRELTGLQARLSRPLPKSPSRLATAKRLRLLAEQRAVQARRGAQLTETQSYEARRDLLPVRIDLARRRVKRSEARLAAWQARATHLRKASARRAAEASARLRRETATSKVPELQALAALNEVLASRRTGADGLPAAIDARTEDLRRLERDLRTTRTRFQALRRKLEAAGLTHAMGRLLRLQLDQLQDVPALERRLDAAQEAISSDQFQQILWEEEQRRLQDPEAETRRLLAGLDPETRREVQPVARRLVEERAQLLEAVIEEQTLLLERRVAIRAQLAQLLAATRAFRTHIEERILWVRSVGRDPIKNLPAAGPALVWLVSSDDWSAALSATASTARSRPGAATGWVLLVLAVCVAAFTLSRRRLPALCEAPWKAENASFGRTLEAVLHTLLIALPGPLLLFTAGKLLQAPLQQLGIGRAVAAGLIAAALPFLLLGLLAALLRPQGVAETHFRWRKQTTEYIRWHLRWCAPLVVLTTFLVATFDQQSNTTWNDSLGLLAFSLQMVALSVLAQRLARPAGPVVSPILQRNPDGWIDRLKYLWSGALVTIPLLLGSFAALGFFYSAILLYRRLGATVALAFGLVLTSALMTRWLGLVRLRLALEEAERRREEAAQEDDAEGDSDVAPGDAAPKLTETDDRASFGSRAHQLVSSALAVTFMLGIYVVWSDVLPAFRRLERLQIYPEMTVLPPAEETATLAPLLGDQAPAQASSPGTSSSESAASSTPTPGLLPGTAEAGKKETSERPPTRVTAADVVMALLILGFTILLGKNLPSLIEVAILQRLPIDAGVRFAIVTILRYGIVIVGGAAALSTAGIRWANIQWLAAALTFGLAFGLQEIFANFVSGLIILIERPVRVGDAVTVGEVSGTVTRLQMRATTITDWDNKELIIPNKEFVTGQVINWSLSSPHLRLRIPVGIAYGSDTKKAERLMLQAAREHPRVLDDPPPTAVFLAFGSSTLDFELRVFIPHPKHRFAVRHQLLERLNRCFNEAGLEISYPQQDVHLRPTQPLLELLGAESEPETSETRPETPASRTLAGAV